MLADVIMPRRIYANESACQYAFASSFDSGDARADHEPMTTPINLEAKRIADELDAAMRAYRATPSSKPGISQRALAALSGVPQPTISRTLKMVSVPETETLSRLSQALRRPIGGYHARAADLALDTADGPLIHQALVLLRGMSQQGLYMALGALGEIRKAHPAQIANPAG